MSARPTYSHRIGGVEVFASNGSMAINGRPVSPAQARALRKALKRAVSVAECRIHPSDCDHVWEKEENFGGWDLQCTVCQRKASKEEREVYITENTESPQP